MAHQAALEIVRHPAGIYNPLFIHGGCGLGKTHLLQGSGNASGRQAARTAAGRTSAARSSPTSSSWPSARGRLESFRQRYRNLDVLIIDDVHFLANKKATQEEFLHTFNAIDAGASRSCWPPTRIPS